MDQTIPLNGENLPLSQVLLLDNCQMGNHTYYRHPELKRVTNAVVGTLAEVPSLGPVQTKPLSSLGVEELKSVRSLSQSSLKVGEKINVSDEAIDKLHRYHRLMLPRKRSQIEIPAPVPHKQVCTSMMNIRVQGHPNNISRASIMTDREGDILRSRKVSTHSKDKDQTLTARSESWETEKLIRRCSGTKLNVSVKSEANRMLDGDKDYKQGIQRRPSSETHSRSSESHGFRFNICNKNHAANPAKGESGCSFVKSSPNVSHTSPIFDNRKQTSNPNRVQSAGGLNSCKQSLLPGFSSTPAIHWSEQKPRKSQRIKRTNLVPLILNHDNLPNLVERSLIPNSTESSGQGNLICSSNNNAFQHSRLKTGNIFSLAALSESEESGSGDKCENKRKKQGDAIEKNAPVCQKVGLFLLPLFKEKNVIELESGDGVQRPGRSGKDSTPLRTNGPISGNLENPAPRKKLRSTRLVTDKAASLFSRTSQSPTRNTSLDRKGVIQPRCPIKNGLSKLTGDLDDREELLATVNASNNASDVACSGSFCKQMEPFFASATQDNQEFLKQLVREVEDEDAILICPTAGNQTGEADIIYSMLPANGTPIVFGNQKRYIDVSVDNESLKPSSNLNAKEDIKTPGKPSCLYDRMVPLYQRLLSALIAEENSDETNRKLDAGPEDDCLHCTNDYSPCGNCTHIEIDTENAYGIQSQELDLDQRILLELQSIGLFQESMPDLEHRGDEEMKTEICKLKDELQQQELQGTNSCGCKIAQNKVKKQATQSFVEGTLAECRTFEETGKSCLSDASLKEGMVSISLKEKDTKLLGDAIKGDTANSLSDSAHALSDIKTSADPIIPPEQSSHSVVQHTQKMENGDWESCNTRQGTASFSMQTVLKGETWSTPGKNIERLLEEVNKSGILRGTAAVGTTLPRGARRKRSKRDREGKLQAKETIIRSGCTRSHQPDLANTKSEMRNKLKPRHKTSWLSAAENDLLGRPCKAQTTSLASSYWEKNSDILVKVNVEMPVLQNSIADDDTSDDNIPIDLSHLQLPNSDDIANWLNYEDISLPNADTDYIGLAVPNDDVDDLNMF